MVGFYVWLKWENGMELLVVYTMQFVVIENVIPL